jgi:phosphatidylcholine synthase
MVAAWGVHLLTASSVPAGVMAVLATIRHDAQAAFAWMAYTLAVDCFDGTLARAVGVKRVIPWFDGARLDDIVDYFTYVIVPVIFLLHMKMLPAPLALPIATLVLLASAYGFSNLAAKTSDHFFTGFPSYWNVLAFYLTLLDFGPWANALWVTGFAVMVFVPFRYVYPSRTTTLRWLTIGLGLVWMVVTVWLLVVFDEAPRAVVVGSLAYPAYYFALSAVLHRRRARVS